MSFIAEYTDWASMRSPLTPTHFHQNIAATMLAGATAGRAYLQLPHERIYPNLYTLIIATTSVYAKTTAFGIANEVIGQTMKDRVITDISTPEALVYEMAGVEPQNWNRMEEQERAEWTAGRVHGPRRLMMLDEAGRFFNSLQRDYNATLDSLFMSLYDANGTKISRSTVKMGRVTIHHPALSCLFATTPANTRTLLRNHDSWSSGFWGRWCFATATQPLLWQKSIHKDAPATILETLERIDNGWLRKYKDGEAYNMDAHPKVFEAYDTASRASREAIIASDDDHFHSVLSRLPAKHLKLSMLIAIAEANGNKPRLKWSHWNEAREIVEGWQRDSVLAVEEANRTDQVNDEQRILAIIDSYQEGVTSRYLQQRTGKSAKEMNDLLKALHQAGMTAPTASGRTILWKSRKEESVEV